MSFFKIEHIHNLLNSRLNSEGYEHFVSIIAQIIKQNSWHKEYYLPEDKIDASSEKWSVDEIKAFFHDFILWMVNRKKIRNLQSQPDIFLAKYFHSVFNSYAVECLSNNQKKSGLTFNECRRIINSICDEELATIVYSNKKYVSISKFKYSDVLDEVDIEQVIAFVGLPDVKTTTKHYKTVVRELISDILYFIDKPISVKRLERIVWKLFSLKEKVTIENQDEILPEKYEKNNGEFVETFSTNLPIQNQDVSPDEYRYIQEEVNKITSGLGHVEAEIILGVFFSGGINFSMEECLRKHGIKKSTYYSRIKDFDSRLKILSYIPENQLSMKFFIDMLENSLEKIKNVRL